jgi:hypothetical protein
MDTNVSEASAAYTFRKRILLSLKQYICIRQHNSDKSSNKGYLH